MSHPPLREEGAGRTLRIAASCVLVAVVAFYLLTEHLQHTLGALPYVVLLLCPLLHVFMHRGHGGHGGAAPHSDYDHRDGQAPSNSPRG